MESARRVLQQADVQLFSVAGFQRSGTNWLCRLLNHHPDILCDGEYRLDRIWKGIDDTCLPDCKSKYVREYIEDRFYDMVYHVMLHIWLKDTSNTIIGERTPRQLGYHLPDERVLYMVRDGRDIVVSSAYHELNLLRMKIESDGKYKDYGVEWHHFFTAENERIQKFMSDEQYFVNHPEELLNERYVRHMARQWSDFVASDLVRIADREVDAMIIRYQDLFPYENMLSKLKEVYEYLHADISVDWYGQFGPQEMPSFQAAVIRDEGPHGYWYSFGHPYSFNRTGQCGQWSNYFDDHLLEVFYDSLQGPEILKYVLSEMFHETSHH